MKKLFFYLIILNSLTTIVKAQSLIVDSTRFICGVKGYTSILFSIQTKDKGILFVGESYGNCGGIIPSFLLDTVLANVLIGKIDSNQQISWVEVYGGSHDDQAVSACQTSDGGYAVLATTNSNNGDVTGFKGGQDIWLLRIDSIGNLLWEKTFGSSAEATSIANTPDNGFIILGNSNSSDTDVPFHYGGMFADDWVVLKTDSMGNKQWCKDLGGTLEESMGGSILVIDSFYYLISSSNSTDHDCTDTAWHAGVNTLEDYHVLKIDKNGNVLWDSSFGGSNNDVINFAIYDIRDSTIVITGTSGSHNYMVTDSHGGEDFWIMKVNKNGALIWKKALGSINNDGGTGICVAPNSGYIVYGNTYADTGTIGRIDLWVFYIDSAGNEITNKIFGGTNQDNSYSITPYLNGYMATGISLSTTFTEGSSYGRHGIGQQAFVSYISYWKLEIDKVNNANQIKVYPNPANKYVQISLSNCQAGNLRIDNCLGQIIYSKKNDEQNIEINTTEWNDGIYFIKWQSEAGTVLTSKFIKN